jgi:hypothetical protein
VVWCQVLLRIIFLKGEEVNINKTDKLASFTVKGTCIGVTGNLSDLVSGWDAIIRFEKARKSY